MNEREKNKVMKEEGNIKLLKERDPTLVYNYKLSLQIIKVFLAKSKRNLFFISKGPLLLNNNFYVPS